MDLPVEDKVVRKVVRHLDLKEHRKIVRPMDRHKSAKDDAAECEEVLVEVDR